MPTSSRIALGIDFGTESVRALLADMHGNERGSAVAKYKHGQIPMCCPLVVRSFPLLMRCSIHKIGLIVRQRPCAQRLRQAQVDPDDVVGIGVVSLAARCSRRCGMGRRCAT